jgi:8-oxo-dGTP diphosphatase
MDAIIPEFGSRIEGASYTLRPGAYAIIHNDAGEVAVIQTPAGLYLPGGGIEGRESPEEALLRETLEECGMVVRIERRLGMADQLISLTARQVFICKRGTYYIGSVAGWNHEAVCEADHELIWLAPEEAAERLVHESQRYMVVEAVRKE